MVRWESASDRSKRQKQAEDLVQQVFVVVIVFVIVFVGLRPEAALFAAAAAAAVPQWVLVSTIGRWTNYDKR